tara:strand:+ start:128776 stop:128967 length:192 start_codon:yes stop_codon:yes gene_type:complete
VGEWQYFLHSDEAFWGVSVENESSFQLKSLSAQVWVQSELILLQKSHTNQYAPVAQLDRATDF